jgi:hypothetical protein
MNKLVTFLASEENHRRILKWAAMLVALDVSFISVVLLLEFMKR